MTRLALASLASLATLAFVAACGPEPTAAELATLEQGLVAGDGTVVDDDAAQADADDAAAGTAPGDKPAYLVNTANNCVVYADINMKIDMGLTFKNKMTPAQAAEKLIKALTTAKCYGSDGFGPTNGQLPSECLQALKNENEEIVDEGIRCSWNVNFGGSTLPEWLDGKKNSSIIGNSGHATGVVDFSSTAAGDTTVTVRDPDDPSKTTTESFKKGKFPGFLYSCELLPKK